MLITCWIETSRALPVLALKSNCLDRWLKRKEEILLWESL